MGDRGLFLDRCTENVHVISKKSRGKLYQNQIELICIQLHNFLRTFFVPLHGYLDCHIFGILKNFQFTQLEVNYQLTSSVISLNDVSASLYSKSMSPQKPWITSNWNLYYFMVLWKHFPTSTLWRGTMRSVDCASLKKVNIKVRKVLNEKKWKDESRD